VSKTGDFAFGLKMSLRMVLSSSDGSDFFPNNKSHDFRVKLGRSLQFEGYWVVALTEINTSDRGQTKELFVYSDICQDSFSGSSERPLLRRVFYEDKDQNNIVYDNPYYVPIKQPDIQQIRVYIKDSNGQHASFFKGKV